VNCYRGPIKIPVCCLSVYAYWNLRATEVIYVKLDNGECYESLIFIRLVYF
jgi:hypothetical protein